MQRRIREVSRLRDPPHFVRGHHLFRRRHRVGHEFIVGFFLRLGPCRQGGFLDLGHETDGGQVVFVTELEGSGLIRRREIQRGLIVGDNGAGGLFFPVPGRKFAAIEREHHGDFSHRDAPDFTTDRIPAAGAAEAWGVVRFGQVDRVPDDLEVLRQRKRRDLDFDRCIAVATALQRQHDRWLRIAAMSVLTIIGTHAALDFRTKVRIRPTRRDVGI